ncbi:prephenate dehydrogenase [Allorhodopirellula solitaria]|uniref:prephenate dehydrogenase n=1 Tax=Allorhodopirellula solitaria TaxID=2527987 RepID=UPI001FEAB378|nr:prephenate dehydrogenase/arogenate dehydrogenase family protein [Allorhodopirellula solitaria]
MNISDFANESSSSPIRTVAVIGLGLLGGSVAKSLRRSVGEASPRVIGWGRRPETREFAINHDLVDAVSDDFVEASRLADLVVIATPVDRIAQYAIEVAKECPNVLITDVGSTKRGIVDAVAAAPRAATRFVAAHPIAGSEKTGIEFARDDLFDQKSIVITPSGHEVAGAVDAVDQFWRSTGGRTRRLSPQQHDEMMAVTSHAPHLISAMVARQVPDEAIALVGRGWLDTTRIAAGDEGLWTSIVTENRAAILAAMQAAAQDLSRLVEIIETADDEALTEYLRAARQQRESARPPRNPSAPAKAVKTVPPPNIHPPR